MQMCFGLNNGMRIEKIGKLLHRIELNHTIWNLHNLFSSDSLELPNRLDI